MTGEHPGRTPMAVIPGQGIVWVPDEQVKDRVEQGWTKFSRRSAPTTGSIPKQQSGN